jgi:hypothetical protein
MCTHHPACLPADAIDSRAARNITEHPGQGWTLLCNDALVFDDHGTLLPDGRVAAISSVPPAPGIPGGGPDSSIEQMQYVFHELHADGQHALCAVCGSQAGSRPARDLGEPVSGASATVRCEQEILYEHLS